MPNQVLNSLLKEYEQKKLKAELDLERRKNLLYQKIPRLQSIEDEINAFAIYTTKNILQKESSLTELTQKIESLTLEKNEILVKNNISSSYLKPFYECSVCKDTGYFMQDNYKTSMCTCLKQKLLDISFHQSNMTHLENENFQTFNESIFSDEVDLSKYRFNISPRENMKQIKQKCMEFVNDFDLPDTKNLLFSGNTGLR